MTKCNMVIDNVLRYTRIREHIDDVSITLLGDNVILYAHYVYFVVLHVCRRIILLIAAAHVCYV